MVSMREKKELDKGRYKLFDYRRHGDCRYIATACVIQSAFEHGGNICDRPEGFYFC